MNRDALVNLLKKGIVEVVFMKKDSTIRRMLCTLHSSKLPELKGSNHKRNKEVIPVWDLEKEAWRSFRIDSIIEGGINLIKEI